MAAAREVAGMGAGTMAVAGRCGRGLWVDGGGLGGSGEGGDGEGVGQLGWVGGGGRGEGGGEHINYLTYDVCVQ